MKKKKVTFAKFTDSGRRNAVKQAARTRGVKANKLTSHERRIKKIKEVSNGCWWIEQYLYDRCIIFKDK